MCKDKDEDTDERSAYRSYLWEHLDITDEEMYEIVREHKTLS